MPLTQTAKYALRAMATLANVEQGELVGTRKLAEITGIPVHYLSKIMRRLVVQKLVVSRKGHGGGFVLAKPTRKITFASILEAGNFIIEPNICAYGWGSCDQNQPCPLHETYNQLLASVSEWMEKTTLAHVGQDPRIREMLEHEEAD